MTNEPTAAEGALASAAPELPLLQGITETATLSLAEGSSLGLPAGSIAQSEVQPLRSEANAATLRQREQMSLPLPECFF